VAKNFQVAAFTCEYMECTDRWIEKMATVKLDKKNLFIQEQTLASNWGIGLTDASNTLKATTQSFIRNALHPIER
jgi:hypothetical protein